MTSLVSATTNINQAKIATHMGARGKGSDYEGQDMDSNTRLFLVKENLRAMPYCLPCIGTIHSDRGEGWISGSIPSRSIGTTQDDGVSVGIRHNDRNGMREGPTDPSLPSLLVHTWE